MAKPISVTPVLSGKQYENFLKEVFSAENKKAPRKEVKRGLKLFEIMEKKLEKSKTSF